MTAMAMAPFKETNFYQNQSIFGRISYYQRSNSEIDALRSQSYNDDVI